jgi:hypothetical protein
MKNFWDKVNILDDEQACWEWMGMTDGGAGYGRLQENGHIVQAHRKAWEISNDEKIPEGLVVRHTCDNPKCCNPNHLLLGTQQQNMQDKIARKVLNAPHKLTEQDVLAIYKLHQQGNSNGTIARMYNVTIMNISCIVNGKSWRYLYQQYTNVLCAPMK